MEDQDRYWAVERVRRLRRRYFARMLRIGAKGWIKTLTTPRAQAAAAGLLGLVLVSAPLWMSGHMAATASDRAAVWSQD